MAQENFQEQLVSIMELVAKAAVTEIKRRVEDSCAVIRLELSRSQRDIDALKRKCQVMENELRKARGRGRRRVFLCGTSEKLAVPCQHTCPRESGVNVTRAEQRVTLQEADAEMSSQHVHQTVDILDVTPDPPVIKQEGNENRPWNNGEAEVDYLSGHQNMSPSPAQNTHKEQNLLHEDMVGASPNIQPLLGPAKSEVRSPGGVRLQVKSEEEEEEEQEREVPEVISGQMEQGMNETEDLEFSVEQREVQLWPSIPKSESDGESERTEKHFSSSSLSRDFSVLPQHVDTASEQSGNDVLPVEGAHMELYNAQQDWCQEERGHHSNLVCQSKSVNLNAQQRHRTPTRPAEVSIGTSTATPNPANVATQALWGYSRGVISSGKRLRTPWRSATTGERRFSCSLCEKRFARFGQLKEHLRSHTGERPYTCTQCGRSFTKQGNLIRHAVVHSGEKPYQCLLCGKCFTQRSSLKSHQKMHMTDRDGSLQGLSMYSSVRDPHNGLSITQTRSFV